MSLKDGLPCFWQCALIMGAEQEQNELDDLKTLLEKNTEAIEKLRGMIENMEVVLLSLSEQKASSVKPEEVHGSKEPR
jgi:hypothetical protein